MLTQNAFGLPSLAINIINSIIIIVIGQIAIWIFKKAITSFFKISKKNLPLYNSKTIITVLSSLVKYVIYAFVLIQIMTIFGASKESLLAIASIGSIAIGFGARGIAEDFFVGASILFENQFKVGDIISIDGKTGEVESIGLRITTIRSLDGDVHIFPNSSIKLVTNMSKSFNRAVVELPVSYSESIENVLNILKEEMDIAGKEIKSMISPPIIQGIVEMNNICLIIRILADCNVGDNWAVERELRLRIKTRFEKENIMPPYPHLLCNNWRG